jgi:hypothetical protein
VWWPKYVAQVDASVSAAEQHLEVPAGSISSISTEADFIATVKTCAVIEPILNDLIAARPPQAHHFGALSLPEQNENFRNFVTALPFSGNTGKLRLAKGMGLLTEWQTQFIRAVALVRNRYAHNVKNMHRSLTEILTDEQQSNRRIVAHLTGMEAMLPLAFSDSNLILKIFMYHRLADYLADALHTLRPATPAGGRFARGTLGSDPERTECKRRGLIRYLVRAPRKSWINLSSEKLRFRRHHCHALGTGPRGSSFASL